MQIELNMFPAWLNNCVGHFNHRYFFSFCLYMTLGCIYCSISSRDLFLEAYSAIEVNDLHFEWSFPLTPRLPFSLDSTGFGFSGLFMRFVDALLMVRVETLSSLGEEL